MSETFKELQATGPAISESEALGIKQVVTGPGWPIFKKYMARRQTDALKKVMERVGHHDGDAYYKAVFNVLGEILSLEGSIGKQIQAMEASDEKMDE